MMTKAEIVRRMMARASIKGTSHERLVQQVMKRCEFKRGLAVTYIRKIGESEAYRQVLREFRKKHAEKTGEPVRRGPGRPRVIKPAAKVAVEPKRRGRKPKVVADTPAVAETTLAIADTPAVQDTPVENLIWPFPAVETPDSIFA